MTADPMAPTAHKGTANPLFSIILPVHNVAQYLPDCMNSILSSSFSDIEIIAIDDGSTDASAAILQRFQRQDGRLRVLTQHNLGVGAARNAGLRQARGRYILFIDPDDSLVNRDALSHLARKVHTGTADLVVFGYVQYDKRGDTTQRWVLGDTVLQKRHLTAVGPLVSELAKRRLFIPVWNKAYRREFLDTAGIEFTNHPVGEDGLFNCAVLRAATTISVVDDCVYAYRIRSGSATSTWNPDRFLDGAPFRSQFVSLLTDAGGEVWLARRESVYAAFSAVIQALASPHPMGECARLMRQPEYAAELRAIPVTTITGHGYRLLLLFIALRTLFFIGGLLHMPHVSRTHRRGCQIISPRQPRPSPAHRTHPRRGR